MNWLAITTVVLCAWAFLRVLGGERQRLIQELPPDPIPTAEAAPEPAPTSAPAKAAKPNPKPR
jgi:hypothetical protein